MCHIVIFLTNSHIIYLLRSTYLYIYIINMYFFVQLTRPDYTLPLSFVRGLNQFSGNCNGYNIIYHFDKSVVCGVNSADVRIRSSKTFCRIQTRRNEFSFLMIFFSARIIAPQFQSRLIIYYMYNIMGTYYSQYM